jgi:vacuolar-type H+-ATPase subunit I/STV1
MSNLDDKLRAMADQVIEYRERLPTWNEWLVAHDELPIQEWLVAYINVQTLAPMKTAEEVESHDDFIKQRLEETAAKLERLTKELDEAWRERDEARREICRRAITNSEWQKDFARGRNWDCFKEAP